MKSLAVCLLAALMLRHYGWDLAPPELAGVASKMLGASESIALLLIVAHFARHPAVWCVVAYGIVEHGMTAICSAAYLARPWDIPPGQPMCSHAVGFEIGAVGVAVAAALLLWLVKLSDIAVSNEPHGAKNE